jgi:hypothetical protein
MQRVHTAPNYTATVADVQARILAEATAYATREVLARRRDTTPADGLPLVIPEGEWPTFTQQRTQWAALALAELQRELAHALGVTVADLDAATRSPEPATDVPAADWRPADA